MTYVKINGSFQNVTLQDMEQYYGHPMLTYDDDNFSEAKFMTFVHIDHGFIAPFLEIVLNSTRLTITENHLLYKLRGNHKTHAYVYNTNDTFNECSERVFSGTLVIGDFLCVFRPDTQTLELEQIVSINNVTRVGIYSPMPECGEKFFVNNVLVSPYSYIDMPILNSVHYAYAKVVSYLN